VFRRKRRPIREKNEPRRGREIRDHIKKLNATSPKREKGCYRQKKNAPKLQECGTRVQRSNQFAWAAVHREKSIPKGGPNPGKKEAVERAGRSKGTSDEDPEKKEEEDGTEKKNR